MVVPIHYEGWKHFREGREAIEREFAHAPEDVRRAVRWLPIGEPVALRPDATGSERPTGSARTPRTPGA